MGTEGPQLVEPFCENDGVAGVEALKQPEKVLLGVRRNYSVPELGLQLLHPAA